MIEGSLGSSLFCSPGYFRLQVLPDDPGDNTYGHTPLHIQTGDSKRYIVLFAGHPVVIAGVGYRIDAIGEAHIDNALVDIILMIPMMMDMTMFIWMGIMIMIDMIETVTTRMV